MFAARGGAAPRGLSIEVLLYISRVRSLFGGFVVDLVANTGGIFLSVLRRIVTPRASRPTGATRGLFRAQGVMHSYCTGATQLGDIPRILMAWDECVVSSSQCNQVCAPPASRMQTHALLRSEETFTTTHNRNHGPRACREHAKRIALIMQQKLATSAAHASHTRDRATHSIDEGARISPHSSKTVESNLSVSPKARVTSTAYAKNVVKVQ